MTTGASAANPLLRTRRQQVRDGRLVPLPPKHWHLHQLAFRHLAPRLQQDLTCAICHARVYHAHVYYDLVEHVVLAFRRCHNCRHSWEL